jgi:hypothetical protein
MSMRNLTRSAVGVALLSVILPTTAGATQEAAVVGREPSYPTGPSYEAFTATLPGLGLLIDYSGNGAVNDEWCDSDGEARLAIVGATFRTVVAAGTACGALPTPVKEGCYVGLAVVAAALQSEATVIVQCAYQDSLVDGATLNAAYENTRHALAFRLEQHLSRCDTLLSLQQPQAEGGRAEELAGLVETRIQQFEALGLSPTHAQRARTWLTRGTTEFGKARYYTALSHYCTAYQTLQAAP